MNSAAALGVILRYGVIAVSDAIAACDRGVATPNQQRILADLIKALGAS
jgi:hypothetical protein